LYPQQLDGSCHNTLEAVIQLYEQSFPEHERRDTANFITTLQHASLQFCSWHDAQGQVRALSSLWQHAQFAYLEYLAISPAQQGHGHGSAILKHILAQNPGKPLILDIDPPLDAHSRRRLAFYEKMHFEANEQFNFRHPPYRAGGQPFAMLVLCCPQRLEPELFAEFCRFHRDCVVGGLPA